MVSEIRYTTVKRVLDDLLDHPQLRDLTLEQVVRHVIRFIALHGYPKLYEDKIENVEIHEFRGLLPCDLIKIIQVKDLKHHVCMRAMTDNFTPGMRPEVEERGERREEREIHHHSHPFHHPHHFWHGEPAFKTQGRIIYTSFPEGIIQISYKSIPVDEDGYPKLIDNEVYLGALEAYIKKQVFTVKFDTGKISSGVLDNAKQDYAFLAKELQAEFTIPSVSEAEAMSRQYQTLILNMRSFDRGFKDLGNREYLRRH